MSRFLFKTIKIFHATNHCIWQWRRVILYSLNSCLYENTKSLSNVTDIVEIYGRSKLCNPSRHALIGDRSNNANRSNFNLIGDSNSNVVFYSSDEKQKQRKFFDKNLGSCEIREHKDKHGHYKIMVCKKDGKQSTTKNRMELPEDVNILKLLGAVALTLVGIILAVYSTVFVISFAANVIVFIAIIAFFIISFRIMKEWWIMKGRRRR